MCSFGPEERAWGKPRTHDGGERIGRAIPSAGLRAGSGVADARRRSGAHDGCNNVSMHCTAPGTHHSVGTVTRAVACARGRGQRATKSAADHPRGGPGRVKDAAGAERLGH